MSKLISEDELAHYGIPGQKKGIRRWQYEDGRFNEEGKIRYFGTKNPRNAKNGIGLSWTLKTYTSGKIPQVEEVAEAIKSNNFTVKNDIKNYASIKNRLQLNKINNDIKARRQNEKIDEESGLYLKNKNSLTMEHIEKDIKNVNPVYNLHSFSVRLIPYVPGWMEIGDMNYIKNSGMNCAITSAATVLRLKGYDAVANNNVRINNKMTGPGFLSKRNELNKYSEALFGKSAVKKIEIEEPKKDDLVADYSSKNRSKITNQLKQMKNNEVAMCTIFFTNYGSGHAINVKKINNKLYFLDGQNGKVEPVSDRLAGADYCFDNVNIINLDKIKVTSNAARYVSHSLFRKEVPMSKLISEDELAHYGIPGQKKGVRRWQYEDGRFNEEGKIRYFGTKNPRNELKIANENYKRLYKKYKNSYLNFNKILANPVTNFLSKFFLPNVIAYEYLNFKQANDYINMIKAEQKLKKLKNNLEKMDEFEKGQVDFQYNGIKDFIRDNIPNKKTSKKDVMQNIDDRILDAYLKDDFQEIYKLNNIKNIISQTYKEEKTFLGNMFQVFKNDASNKLGHDLSKFMFGGN